ncbi:MAG: hypothetical protein QHH06_14625 [Clostridiales bacterium]|nr:hypothetical protein [Eubacteriales bacterium]MDH7567675.1 hypothetical protein [Clostridiales bacterium]
MIIGAGNFGREVAQLIRNIPENCTAVGVPAKPIKFNAFSPEELYDGVRYSDYALQASSVF